MTMSVALPAGTIHAGAPVHLQRVTNQPRRLGRIPFLIMLSGLLLAGMVGVLVLTTTIQAQSRALRDYQTLAAALSEEQAALSGEVAQLRSATHLVQAASALGLRPNPAPAMIRLADGTIAGAPAPAPAGALPHQVWTGPVAQNTPPPIIIAPVPQTDSGAPPVADGGAAGGNTGGQ